MGGWVVGRVKGGGGRRVAGEVEAGAIVCSVPCWEHSW